LLARWSNGTTRFVRDGRVPAADAAASAAHVDVIVRSTNHPARVRLPHLRRHPELGRKDNPKEVPYDPLTMCGGAIYTLWGIIPHPV
jgi:hypothetical protein